jgi:hypothetical protein
MGMAAGILGTGAQMAGTMMEAQNKQKAQKQQEENLRNWYLQQFMMRQQEGQRQNKLRLGADKAFRDNIYGTASANAQMGNALQEQQRLQGEYARGTSAAATPASDASIAAGSQAGALTGQSGGDKEVRSDLAARLNNAAGSARNRIAALATMNSVGDSQFGNANVVPLGFQQAAWDLRKFNDFRRGSMNAYGVEKNSIQPQQVQYKQSGAGQALSGLGGLLGGLGKGGGGGMF